MKYISIKYLLCSVAVMCVSIPFAAKAEEQLMELWPNQRAKYVIKSEENAAKYESRGRDYVAHTYSTGGEEPSQPASDFMHETEPDIEPKPIDVNQVSDIVGKYTGSIIEEPAKPEKPSQPAQ